MYRPVASPNVDGNNSETTCSQDTLEVFQKPMNTGSNISFFPPEILLSVFSLTIPPYGLLDTTVTAGKNSTWSQALRLMKSIVLVCRSWYDVGIIFLYENICIRRGQELDSLRKTLTGPAKNLGLLVKSLTIQCYVPEDDFDFGAKLETLIGCCTSLSAFSFNTPFVPPPHALPIAFPARITHLRLEGYFDFNLVLPVLKQLEKTLLSLHIMIWDDNSVQPSNLDILQSQFLCLSSLQSLTVAALYEFGMLGGCWEMPSLKRLTVVRDGLFRHDYRGCLDYSRMQTTILSFLRVFGHQIRELHLALEGFQFIPKNFKTVLELCPRLERIIMDPSTLLQQYWTDSDRFFHQRLRFIDLTYLHTNDHSPYALCLSKKNLPSLEYVRRFCNFPAAEHLYKWLGDCVPNPEVEKGEIVIDVFQHHLDCQEACYIWMLEQDVLKDRVSIGEVFSGSFAVWEDVNSDEDSDYIPTSSDEEGSSEEEGPSEEDEWTTDLSDL